MITERFRATGGTTTTEEYDGMSQLAVLFDGRIIGYVTPRTVQTDPYTWVQTWDLADEQLNFDTYEDACAYLTERYAKTMETNA